MFLFHFELWAFIYSTGQNSLNSGANMISENADDDVNTNNLNNNMGNEQFIQTKILYI